MSAYSGLSLLYDDLMQDAPYQEWIQFITEKFPLLCEYSVADVGCGTGFLTLELAKAAQSVTGVDISEDMLAVALNRSKQFGGSNIQFVCQDVRTLQLQSQVDLVVSTVDSLNYLITRDDLEKALLAIRKSLKPDGWLAFDMLGPRRIHHLMDGLWYDMSDERVVLYETDVADNGLIEYDVTMFSATKSGLYQRFEEHHQQYAFSKKQIEEVLEHCGFDIEVCVGDFGSSSIEESDRLIFIAKQKWN